MNKSNREQVEISPKKLLEELGFDAIYEFLLDNRKKIRSGLAVVKIGSADRTPRS